MSDNGDPKSATAGGAQQFAALSAVELDAIIARMKRVEAFFKDRLDIDIYLTWGTLLGAVRSGDLIPFDTDVDIAYLSPMASDHEIVEEHDVIRHMLFRNDMIVTLNSKGQIHIAAEDGAATGQRDKASLDLWTTWTRDGKYFHYPDIQGDLPGDAIRPLKRLALRGTEFWVPNRPEAVLEAFYGPEWRVPDPSYAWYPKRAQNDPFEFLRHERREVPVPARPARVEGIDTREDGEIFILRAPGRDKPVRLNPTAMLILELCDGNRSVNDIAALVQSAYRMDSSPLVVVSQFLTQAVDEGLIRPAA